MNSSGKKKRGIIKEMREMVYRHFEHSFEKYRVLNDCYCEVFMNDSIPIIVEYRYTNNGKKITEYILTTTTEAMVVDEFDLCICKNNGEKRDIVKDSLYKWNIELNMLGFKIDVKDVIRVNTEFLNEPNGNGKKFKCWKVEFL